MVIWVALLMQNVPIDAVLHFDLHAAILGWLLTARSAQIAASVAQVLFICSYLIIVLHMLISYCAAEINHPRNAA